MGLRREPTARQVRLATELRRLREAAGLKAREAAALLGVSSTQINQIEYGHSGVSEKRLRSLAAHYACMDDAFIDALVAMATDRTRGWWEEYRGHLPSAFLDLAELEHHATYRADVECLHIPGLLQTEEYARAVFGVLRPPLDDVVVDERVAARLARQEIFHRKPSPLISFVIDESVLRRPVGGWNVLRGQLEQVLLVSHMRHVEVQVMPLDREENAGMAGPFTLIETDDGRRIAYVEVQNVSRVHSDREPVRALEAKYGTLRAQALTPRESLAYVEKLLGEL